MPNSFAYLVFWCWPFVVLWLLVKYPIKVAIFNSIILATLLLPANFIIDPPLLPPLNRETITSLSLVIFLFILGKRLRVSKSGVIIKLTICYFVVILLSSALNLDPVMAGGKLLPGLDFYDAFSSIVQTTIWIIPFFIGRHFFNDVKDNEKVFKTLVVLALIYSLPMLYELRFSPQLHNIIYGYHAFDFVQQVRSEGFRPGVLVGHGLALSFIISTCCISAIALHKNKVRIGRFSSFSTALCLILIIILSKTWSAVIYIGIASLFIYVFNSKKQTKWALILASFVLLYPVGNITKAIPDKEIVAYINEYDVDRGQSLEFRFQNEEALLNRALLRPYFGWGGWGRNRIYDNTGKDISVTDGTWIIVYGIYGGVGFLFYYLILLTPLYYAVKNIKYIKESKDQIYFATLAIILSISLIDSVPNAGMVSIHLLLAGALLGQSELLNKQKNLIGKERVIND